MREYALRANQVREPVWGHRPQIGQCEVRLAIAAKVDAKHGKQPLIANDRQQSAVGGRAIADRAGGESHIAKRAGRSCAT